MSKVNDNPLPLGTIKAQDLIVVKLRGGKHPLWNAHRRQGLLIIAGAGNPITGAGNTADNAIKDYQAKHRRMARK